MADVNVGLPPTLPSVATPKRKRDQLSGGARLDTGHHISPLVPHTSSKFSFELPRPDEGEDGSQSPRSKVARRLQGLALNGGGGVAGTASLTTLAAPGEATMGRSRQDGSPSRQPPRPGFPAIKDGAFQMAKRPKVHSPPRQPMRLQQESVGLAPLFYEHSTSVFAPIVDAPEVDWTRTLQAPRTPGLPLAPPTPTANYSGSSPRKFQFGSSAKSQQKPRPGTPPPPVAKLVADAGAVPDRIPGQMSLGSLPNILPGGLPVSQPTQGEGDSGGSSLDVDNQMHGDADGDDEAELAEDELDEDEMPIDPVRANLTWQEHEISIYDPEDEDDDGTGINGIGFKPTPAIARARIQKRKQQIAEYRKREDREARAKRSMRRRGSPVKAPIAAASTAATAEGGAKLAVSDDNDAEEDDKPRKRRVRFNEIEPTAVVMTI